MEMILSDMRIRDVNQYFNTRIFIIIFLTFLNFFIVISFYFSLTCGYATLVILDVYSLQM